MNIENASVGFNNYLCQLHHVLVTYATKEEEEEEEDDDDDDDEEEERKSTSF